MNRLIVDSATLDAKSQAELVVICAQGGVDINALTRLERMLWASGYKIGYASGASDANADLQSALDGAVK